MHHGDEEEENRRTQPTPALAPRPADNGPAFVAGFAQSTLRLQARSSLGLGARWSWCCSLLSSELLNRFMVRVGSGNSSVRSSESEQRTNLTASWPRPWPYDPHHPSSIIALLVRRHGFRPPGTAVSGELRVFHSAFNNRADVYAIQNPAAAGIWRIAHSASQSTTKGRRERKKKWRIDRTSLSNCNHFFWRLRKNFRDFF
jgi:hypothetical protein